VHDDDLLSENVTRNLLEELRIARDRYAANASVTGEYERAVKRLNDFLVAGIWPEELEPLGKSSSSRLWACLKPEQCQ